MGSELGVGAPRRCCLLDSQSLETSNLKRLNPLYEAEIVKRGMNSITVQPLVADEAFMPHMEAMYVPFHMGYGSLICY